jgi:hypothetical protein
MPFFIDDGYCGSMISLMARMVITRTMIDAAMESFRWAPANFQRAAKAAGISWRTSKKLWLYGLPGKTRPLRDVNADEQIEIRARLWEEDHDHARNGGASSSDLLSAATLAHVGENGRQ